MRVFVSENQISGAVYGLTTDSNVSKALIHYLVETELYCSSATTAMQEALDGLWGSKVETFQSLLRTLTN